MSTSKLWSMICGMERARRGADGEEMTYQYLGKVVKELDAAISYTANGGRGLFQPPKDGSEERLKDYKRLGEERKHPKYACQTGRIRVSVTEDGAAPLIAEIKLFPMGEAETEEEFSFANGNPDFFRRFSEENGEFSMELPAGRYYMMVSKGSEYEIKRSVVNVPVEGTAEVTVRLHRFINLNNEGWYVGDLHHHSVYSSPLYPPQGTDYVYDTPRTVAMSMQAAGLTFGALSDHHNVFNHREWEKLETPDFLPILSKEISTTNGHVLALNVDEDMIYRIPSEEERTDEYLRNEFIRLTGEIRSLGGHPQLNHPRDMQKSISFNPAYTDIIDIFDTIEIWNGSHPMEEETTNYEAFRLWLSLLEDDRFLAATTGSDTHEVSLEFWMDSFCYLLSMYREVKKAYGGLSEELKKKADYFFAMTEPQLDKLQAWEKLNLTSGCVRTYVKAEERTPKNLLAHLKKGNSFVTNGPVLIAEINGKQMGETAPFAVDAKEITAKLTILANRPLTKLTVWQNGGRKEELPLPSVEAENGCYDYSGEVRISAAGAKWVFFQVKDDYTNQAMTNPIFLVAE
ncbi:MAG: CehA/McbA family metallohydrolase [Lachnospiraceae bacterium]